MPEDNLNMSDSDPTVGVQPRNEKMVDIGEEQLALVYAKAFVGAAVAHGDPQGLVDELHSLVEDVLEPHPDFEHALCGYFLSHDERVHLIETVLGGRASQEVINLLKAMSYHNRTSVLRLLVKTVHRLYAESQGRYQVSVRVAQALGDELKEELRNSLQATLGIEPVLDIRVDPELLGGIVVQVGDTVYDGSVRTMLERTRQRMITNAIDAIESRPQSFHSAEASDAEIT